MYANIIVDISHEKLDRPFQYRIPGRLEESIVPGVKVDVPFGNGNRLITGYVIEVTDRCDYDPEKTKEIIRINQKGMDIEAQLISLAAAIRENFGGTMNQALKTVLPVNRKTAENNKRFIHLKCQDMEAKNFLAECQRKELCRPL